MMIYGLLRREKSYELVQVVTEELGALAPAVAVVDAEEGALGPVLDLALLALGLHDVQDYRHTVFVVGPSTLVRDGFKLT